MFSFRCKHLVRNSFFLLFLSFHAQISIILTFSAVILLFISLHTSCSKELRQEMKLLTCWPVLFQAELA